MPRALRPWATCAGTMGARRACSSRTCWSACASAWPIRRPMAGCGRVGKWRAGWPASSGLPRSVSNVAGRLCARSSGRSRSRARVIRRRPRPRRNPRLKKTRRSRCRRGRAPSRPPGRGVCDRRAPPRPEAGPAPRLGAQGRAPDRTRPSPLQVALRHGLHPAPLGRDDLVSLHRRLQGVLRRAPCCLRRGKRGRPRAQPRARAGPSRLAHRTEPSRSRRDQAVPSAELHTRASARGASLARARRACREHLLCDTCRSRGRHRPALHRTRQPRPAHRHKLPLVAQTRPTEVISRKPYDKLVKQWLPPSMHAELPITRIKGPPNFASKDEEVLLQISDACAFVLQRYLKEGSNADRFISAMLGNFAYPIDLGLLKSAAGSYSCLWWPTEQEALERSFIRIAPGLGAEQFS